jgi:hypothetical protein
VAAVADAGRVVALPSLPSYGLIQRAVLVGACMGTSCAGPWSPGVVQHLRVKRRRGTGAMIMQNNSGFSSRELNWP